MAQFIIPTSQTIPYYSETVSLDGQSFNLTFKWNIRDSAWYLSVYTADNEPIVEGTKVVADWPLLRRVTNENKPLGELMAIDTTGFGQDPGFDDFGTRVVLVYLDQDELESIDA